MTRQAEDLTIEFLAEEDVWRPQRMPLAAAERRLVLPAAFSHWAATEWLSHHAGWLARTLGLTGHPVQISTAPPVALRLPVRAGKLHRHWVAFSRCNDWLRHASLPGAVFATNISEYCVGYCFEAVDPPLQIANDLTLLRCSGEDIHWYSRGAQEQRILNRSQTGQPNEPF